MKIRNLLFILAGGLFIYFVFFSGETSSVNKSHESVAFIASPDIYHNVSELYADRKEKELEKRFARLNKRGVFNGTVLYAENGQTIYKDAFGYADFRKRDSLKTSSSFQLASVSKMFTAYAIMILYEQGKLSFDDTLTVFIPEFPYEGVTIRHLLNHRSGLSRYMSLADKYWSVNKPVRNEDIVDLFVKYKPAPYFKPDDGFHYCNTNYALLATVVERVSGKPFDDFVDENIFQPLKMKNSFVYHIENDSVIRYRVPVGVQGYRVRGRRIRGVADYYLNAVMGDKGVYASVEDLFLFNNALDSGDPVSIKTLKMAFSPGSPKYYRRKDNYGFGWRIKDSRDSTVYHFGWWKGFRTYYIRDMRNQAVIIALTNTHSGVSSGVLWDIMDPKYRSRDLIEIYSSLEY